jgi:hypothetical protein
LDHVFIVCIGDNGVPERITFREKVHIVKERPWDAVDTRTEYAGVEIR